jgi:hypothetical protein
MNGSEQISRILEYHMRNAEEAVKKTPEEEEIERNKRQLDALAECVDKYFREEDDMKFLELKKCPNCKRIIKSLLVESEESKISVKTMESYYKVKEFGFYCESCEIIFRFEELSKFTKSKDY